MGAPLLDERTESHPRILKGQHMDTTNPTSICTRSNPQPGADAHEGAAAREDLGGAVVCPTCGKHVTPATPPAAA